MLSSSSSSSITETTSLIKSAKPLITVPRARRFYPKDYVVKMNLSADEFQKDTTQGMPEFVTHSTRAGRILFRISEFFMKPSYWFTKSLSYLLTPDAAQKNNVIVNSVKRVFGLVGMAINLPLALMTFPFGFFFRLISHTSRPVFTVMRRPEGDQAAKEEANQQAKLEIMTHNLGFVPTAMSRVGNLRHPEERASEQGDHVLADNAQDSKEEDPAKKVAPAIIAYQETFNEPATKILAEKIIQKYPFLIHSIAPHISGFNSGAMIASKYPILSIEYHRFDHMIGPEKAAPRGVIKAMINTPDCRTCVYNIHTQALLGNTRAQARKLQLEHVKKILEADLAEDKLENCYVRRVILGDSNTSRINFVGQDNLTPPGQAEEATMQVKQTFKDSFEKDHDPVTGERNQDAPPPRYLERDRILTNVPELEEPRATWFNGIFPSVPSSLAIKLYFERLIHKQPAPAPVPAVQRRLSTPPSWARDAFLRRQAADTAKFDLIIESKDSLEESSQEIRRPANNGQSAATDHLPLQAGFNRWHAL